jgi:hypothetical protein
MGTNPVDRWTRWKQPVESTVDYSPSCLTVRDNTGANLRHSHKLCRRLGHASEHQRHSRERIQVAGRVLRRVAGAAKCVPGGTVTQGVYGGMQQLWDWVFAIIPSNDVVNVAGYSLGAARMHLTPVFLPLEQIGDLAAFEAPKFVQADFYASHVEALAGRRACSTGRISGPRGRGGIRCGTRVRWSITTGCATTQEPTR